MSHLLLVGCGNMGGALLSAWVKHPALAQRRFSVITPRAAELGIHAPQLEGFSSLASFVAHATLPVDHVVWAVKPPVLLELLPSYATALAAMQPRMISLAAGISCTQIAARLSEAAPQAKDWTIIRAMPNTPVRIGQGLTGLCAHTALDEATRQSITQLFAAVGRAVWLESEAPMDAFTVLAGSGPAYVFLFIESLARAAVALGLPAESARAVATDMVLGSAALARAEAATPLATLVAQVASRGGTTEAALDVLQQDQALERLIGHSLHAAEHRAKALRQE